MKAIVPAGSSPKLMCIADARRMLAEAKDLGEIVDLRDRAQAVAHYLRQHGDSEGAMLDAAELKLRAERRLGEILAEMRANGELGGSKTTTMVVQGLGLSHNDSSRWQRIASIPEAEFEKHVAEKRAAGELTTSAALKFAKAMLQPGKAPNAADEESCSVKDLQEAIYSGKKFGTIYADPPWRYQNQGTRASTDNHYQTMTVDEIAALPIKELAADSSHLHLWTTNAFLRESFSIIEAWGFEYKGVYLWCKPQMGIGNYWRVSHELLLLGVRGNLGFLSHDEKSWGEFDRGRHSAKPEQVRHIIERVSPGPRLELFARMQAEGWAVWGNEIERDLWHQQTA